MVLRLWAYLPKKKRRGCGTRKGTLNQNEWMHGFLWLWGYLKKKNEKVVGLAIQLACPLVLILGNGTWDR